VHRLAYARPTAEGEADVADPARRQRPRQVAFDPADGLDEVDGVAAVLVDSGRDGEDVDVEDDLFGSEPDPLGQQREGARGDGGAALQGVGLALLVERHDDHAGAQAAHLARLLEERTLALLEAQRVDQAASLQARQPGAQHRDVGGVDDDRDAGDLRLGRQQVEEAHHLGLRVQHPLVHVDVEHLRAALDLVAGDVERLLQPSLADQAQEAARAGDVGALADVDEVGLGSDGERLQPGEARQAVPLRRYARRVARGGLGEDRDVLRRGAAAAADHVHPALGQERLHHGDHRGGRLVVAAEGVREAGVRVDRRRDPGQPGELLDVRPQRLGPERAVQADRHQRRVLDRGPERLERLTRQGPPRGVGDGAGQHDRDLASQPLTHPVAGVQRRLGVEGVEDRLDQDQVAAAAHQRRHLLLVVARELVEGHRPEARVLDVGAHRGGAVGRSDRAGDEARPVERLEGVRLGPGQAGGRLVDLGDVVLEPVVGQADAGRGEGVGLDDVGARREVGAVDLGDQVRAGERKQVVGALQRTVVVREACAAEVAVGQDVALDHRAHRAVQDQDASLQFAADVADRRHLPSRREAATLHAIRRRLSRRRVARTTRSATPRTGPRRSPSPARRAAA